jgi:hypothetical protein
MISVCKRWLHKAVVACCCWSWCTATIGAKILSEARNATATGHQHQGIGVLDGPRDGSLKSLTKLLNSRQKLFSKWQDDEHDYVRFIRSIGPWMLSPPSYPSPSVHPLPFQLPPWPEINCGDGRYSQVLTGRRLDTPRVIIDFIPFGYDIDKLELRFYEYNDFVDAFVVYESPRTLSGLEKALYFQKVSSTPRFASFMAKVIYLSTSDGDLQSKVNEVKKSLRDGQRFQVNSGSWALEKLMRTDMVQRFARLDASTSALRASIQKRIDAGGGTSGAAALGIQNDADEIITGTTLQHLRHCEIKPEARSGSIYMPCISFKKNYHWMQKTTDLVKCLQGSDITAETASLKSHLWRPGPYVWPLSTILEKGSTFRYEKSGCVYHMGLGAASHMSSAAEPAEYWLKRGGVNEQDFKGAIAPALVEAGKRGAITPELIYQHTILPWCPRGGVNTAAVHVSALPFAQQRIVNASIPILARMYPGRYPFLVPGNNGDAQTAGMMAAAGSTHWGALCKLPNATMY